MKKQNESERKEGNWQERYSNPCINFCEDLISIQVVKIDHMVVFAKFWNLC